MDFYQVLEKRRTIRDFSDKEVTDEVLKKVLSAAFKAPTNDHLRQFEFVVVRGQENIARLVSPVAQNTKNIQQTGLNAAAGEMSTPCLPMRCPSSNVCLCRAIALFCRFSGKRIILCVNLPTKVRSTISLRRGLPLKISCWQQRQKDWHVLSVFPSATNRNM